MKVALDLDMTLNNMAYTWMTWIQENIDPRASLDKVKYFGYLRDAYGKEVDAYWKDPKAYAEIYPMLDAMYFVGQLQTKHDVFILTHTPEGQSSEVKDAWISDYFGDIKVVHSGMKHHHTKGCILIDDHPGHIQRHVRHNDNCHGIVFNHHGLYGWAYPLTDHPRVKLACAYDQAFKLVEDIANDRHSINL